MVRFSYKSWLNLVKLHILLKNSWVCPNFSNRFGEVFEFHFFFFPYSLKVNSIPRTMTQLRRSYTLSPTCSIVQSHGQAFQSSFLAFKWQIHPVTYTIIKPFKKERKLAVATIYEMQFAISWSQSLTYELLFMNKKCSCYHPKNNFPCKLSTTKLLLTNPWK